MANKVGALIKKARTDAGFTQEQLAKKGVSAVSAGTVLVDNTPIICYTGVTLTYSR